MDNKMFLFGVLIGIALYFLCVFIIWFYGRYVYRYSTSRLRSLAITKFATDPNKPSGDTTVQSAAWNGDYFHVVFVVIASDESKTTVERDYTIKEDNSCATGYTIVDGNAIAKAPTCLNI
jgi:hypothetical protein